MSKKLKSIELFTGAGGLAMGLELAGFSHSVVIEWDHDSCETIRANQRNGFRLLKDWNIVEVDARAFKYSTVKDSVDLVAGGPPCQPFSLGGKHGGFNDGRDMWPESVRAVRELQPKAFIFENVKGLLRVAFKDYFDYIILQLSFPSVVRSENEDWQKHYIRLQKKSGTESEYMVQYQLLNAADYGVPQKRERVFIVGFRRDVKVTWDFPSPTHAVKPDGVVSKKWLTVYDAISDLPTVSAYRINGKLPNHHFQSGARFYKGHTGSRLDAPAKTLKAGAHGVPGGENMLVRKDGTCRYFTIREAARLQCFPDEYIFPVSWTESMRQLGNAVPVLLAQCVGESVFNSLSANKQRLNKRTASYAGVRDLQSA